MPISVAFLRGMNVGGHRVTNAELTSIFESLRLTDVVTYRASGNIIFSHRAARERALQTRLERGLQAALGYAVPTFLRTAREVATIASFAPFPAEVVAASKGKIQITMLSEAPGVQAQARALALSTDDDRLAVCGRELYWLPKGGMSESELDLQGLEQALGVGTTRTMGTVQGIAKKCGG
ncbi:MAG: DUF1697 domain-containing protein [Myxococcales bacterium]|nr:DUF1697 domain-containing protein [Myxococcales bacterium]